MIIHAVIILCGEVWNRHLEQSVHLKQNVITVNVFLDANVNVCYVWLIASQSAHCITTQSTLHLKMHIVLHLKMYISFKALAPLHYNSKCTLSLKCAF